MRKRLIILTILAAVLLACSLPIRYVDETRLTPVVVDTPIPAAPVFPTPQPYQPRLPTPTLHQTMTPSLTPEPSQTPLPTPWLNRPPGQVNILVLGIDERPNVRGYRTDVILWVSLNPQQGTASVISFPRDLYVPIPGHQDNRINVAHSFGFQTLAETFAVNFGVRPDYYILTNFEGFTNIVNSLGGIVVDAATDLTDKCDLPQAVNGYCTIRAGANLMDGQTALWYVRARYTTSDFNRARRSREVLLALFRGMVSINAISKAPALYDQYRANVDTDMSLQDIMALVPLATDLIQPGRIRLYNLTSEHVTSFVTETGAQVLLPNIEAIQGLFYQALMP